MLFAVGTFYESVHGRSAAQEVIYRSIFMTGLISLLALNIIAVMIDRYPWKKRHTGFLLAHFGILFVIAGSLMTRLYGVDGNLRVRLGETGQRIMTSSVLFMVYSSFNSKNLTELYRERVMFFRHPPARKNPHLVRLGSDVLKVNDFYPSALARERYEPSLRGGPALRFQIEGSRANIVRWMFQPPGKDKVELSLGPARVVLLRSLALAGGRSAGAGRAEARGEAQGEAPARAIDRPTLFLAPAKGNRLKYKIHWPSTQKSRVGFLKVGSVLNTGWMDLQFRLIEYFPKALPNTVFTPQERAGEGTLSAIQVEFKGEKRWMGLNSHLFFFDEEKVYVTAYINETKPLGFDLLLENFKIVRYPSSFKAVSYESEVKINGGQKRVISMNNPLKFAGYTVYQSGFEEDEAGQPTASVFAINKDPGRFVKYFGSSLIVLGSVILFLRRNLRRRWP